MESYPDPRWLERYERIKYTLRPRSPLDEYFMGRVICGKKTRLLSMGAARFPTGFIMALDPLVYVTRTEQPYFTPVPRGVFPLEAAVVEVEPDHYRYAATRARFKDTQTAYFIEALRGDEDIEHIDDTEEACFFGFNVDAGLATIIDVQTRDVYCDFIEQWEREHPGGDSYEELFAPAFTQSYREQPRFQRPGGDWIHFPLPETDVTVPMFQSGFGDGVYPVYFGYDKNNAINQVVIEFIDIALAFG